MLRSSSPVARWFSVSTCALARKRIASGPPTEARVSLSTPASTKGNITNSRDRPVIEMESRTLNKLSNAKTVKSASYYRQMLERFDNEIIQATREHKLQAKQIDLVPHWVALREKAIKKKLERKAGTGGKPLERYKIETIRYLLKSDPDTFPPMALASHYKISYDQVVRMSKGNSNDLDVLKLRAVLKSVGKLVKEDTAYAETKTWIQRVEDSIKIMLERCNVANASENYNKHTRFIRQQ